MTEVHKSALTDHVGCCNHSIDWGGEKLPAKESDRKKRGILDAIEIQKVGGGQSSQPRQGTPPLAKDVLHAAVNVPYFWHVQRIENNDSGSIRIYVLLCFISLWS